jgi:hypothetical protein
MQAQSILTKPPTMAQTGSSGSCWFPLPTLSSTATAKSAFELVSGAVARLATAQASDTSTEEEYRKFTQRSKAAAIGARYKKLRRVSPVWLAVQMPHSLILIWEW